MANSSNPSWKIVLYRIDLNKKPKADPNSKALVPVNSKRQLAAFPPHQRSASHSYYAQPVLTAPLQPLLLKGPPVKQGTLIKVPAGTKVLPPKPNERVVGIKTNRSVEISSVRYTTKEEHPYF